MTTNFLVTRRLAHCILAFIGIFCFWAQISSGQQVDPTLAEATDNNLTWTSSSFNPWYGQFDVNHDGIDGAIANVTNAYYYDSTWLQTTVTGPAKVSFWWLYDTLDSYGYSMGFYVDGSLSRYGRNLSVWTSNSVDIAYGSHTLKWTAEDYATRGQMLVALDQVTVTPYIGDPPQVTIAQQNPQIELGQPLILTAQVTGTGPFTYSWLHNGTYTYFTSTNAQFTSSFMRSDAGTYTVKVTSLFGTATASTVVTPSYAALNNSLGATLQWTTTGPQDWFAETNVTHDGSLAAQSPPSPAYWSPADLQTTITGPATVSYYLKFSPYLYYYTTEFVNVKLDDGVVHGHSQTDGAFDWTQESVTIPYGTHTLAFEYGNYYYGGHAWVDDVAVTPLIGDAPSVTNQLSDISAAAGDDVSLSVDATGTSPMSYQWWVNDAPIDGATNSVLQFAVAPADTAAYTVVITNIFGETTSSPINLTVTPSSISLKKALDNPDLIWKTGSGDTWFGESHISHDHVSAAQSSSTGDYLQTTVVGPGVLSFWWKSTGTLYVNNETLADTMSANYTGAGEWQQYSFGIPDGPQVIRWYPSGGTGKSWLDQVRFVAGKVAGPKIVTQPHSIATNDFSGPVEFSVTTSGPGPINYQWTFNGSDIDGATSSNLVIDLVMSYQNVGEYAVRVWNSFGTDQSKPATLAISSDLGNKLGDIGAGWGVDYDDGAGYRSWFMQNRVKHGKSPAAQSNTTSDGSSVSMMNTVVGPGTLSFWWKVSSEKGCDFLQFFVAGVVEESISGITGWEHVVYRVPPGAQSVQWTYAKDYTIAAGSDCGWVAEVQFTPDPPPTVRIEPQEQTVYEGEPAVLQAVTTGLTPTSYTWSDDIYGQYQSSSSIKTFPYAIDNPVKSVTITTDAGTATGYATVHVKRGLKGQRTMEGQPVQMKLSTTEKPDAITWYKDGEPLADTTNLHGCSTTTVRLNSAQLANDAGMYNVTASSTRSGWNGGGYAALLVYPHNPVIGWGFTEGSIYYGQWPQEIYTTPDIRDAVAISTSKTYSMALMPDGAVQVWGLGDSPGPDGPQYLYNVKAIGAGDTYGIALLNDGTVQTWQAFPTYPGDDGGTVADSFTDITAISAGGGHYLGLKRNRTVVAGGANDNGQCDVPQDLKGIVAIAAGGMHSLAVTKGGRVVAWGNNDYAQLMPPHVLAGVIAVAAGDQHSVALRSDGTVVAWGDNSFGQCSVPRGLKGVVAIAAGATHSVALTATGQVVTWGGYYFNDGAIDSASVPNGLHNVARIAAGGSHTLALIFAPTVVGTPLVTMLDDSVHSQISVDVGGHGPISYQWRVNGRDIARATNSTLVVRTPKTGQDAAARFLYDVVVRNKYGSDTSTAVTIPTLDGTEPGSVGSVITTVGGTPSAPPIEIPIMPVLPSAVLVAPELSIAKDTDSVVLSWNASGFVLEMSDTANGPFSGTGLPATVNVDGTNRVIVPIDSQQKFYRLRAGSN